MSSILRKVGNTFNVPIKKFECDELLDMINIDTSTAPMGSRCYVIKAQKEYALTSDKKWVEIPRGSGGSDSGGDEPVDPSYKEIIYDGGEEV